MMRRLTAASCSVPRVRRLASRSARSSAGAVDRQPGAHVVAPAADLADQCQVVGVRVQRLTNEFVGHVRAVVLRGVDVVDAEFHRPPQHGNGFIVVTGRPEDTGPGQLHRTEAHPVDVERAKRKAIRGHEFCNPCRVRIHP